MNTDDRIYKSNRDALSVECPECGSQDGVPCKDCDIHVVIHTERFIKASHFNPMVLLKEMADWTVEQDKNDE